MSARQQITAALEALAGAVDEFGFEEVGDEIMSAGDDIGEDAPDWTATLFDQVRCGVMATEALHAGRAVLRFDPKPEERMTFEVQRDQVERLQSAMRAALGTAASG